MLQQISDSCFDSEIFKHPQTKAIIDLAQNEFSENLEFLWEKAPDIAIVRRADNKKWYAVIFVLAKKKLGVESDEVVEIVDLRVEPEKLSSLVDGKSFFKGYHMNKKHWLTMVLDGSIETEKVLELIRSSRNLALKK